METRAGADLKLELSAQFSDASFERLASFCALLDIADKRVTLLSTNQDQFSSVVV